MVHVGKVDGGALINGAADRSFLACQHIEERGLTGSVTADDANNGATRNDGAEVINQQAVTKALAEVVDLYHFLAKPLAGGNKQLSSLSPYFAFFSDQFIKTRHARLTLGLAGLWI